MTLNDDYYKNYYSKVINSGIIGVVSNLTQISLERGIKNRKFSKVLELGAGEGQHFPFVRHQYDQYVCTDLRIDNLIKIKVLSQDPRVILQEVDAHHLQRYADNNFNRVIATCLLAHLNDPLSALLEWRRVVGEGGLISIYVPCEPGLLLRLARALSTARKAKKYVDMPLTRHYLEHINYYLSMHAGIKRVFKNDQIKIKNYPFPFLSWNFNLWKIYTITINK
jgi:phosphatidylethanolamine/phosphatidyl-N-methylethanolamine N-methyltransferase